MDTDDIAPPPQRPAAPLDLEKLSIAELEAHIAALRAEIDRTRATIAAKQQVRGAADLLFRR